MAYKQVLLGDYFKFEKGLGYKGEFLVEDSEVALIGMDSHEEGGGYKEGSEKPYSGPYKPEHVAETGDVIFAATDLTQGGDVLGSPLMVPESDKFETFIYSHHLLKAFKKREGFLPEYLYNLYRVKKYRRKAAYGDSGSTVRALPADVLEEQLVPLPDLKTQESINEVISLIDQQIENNKSLAKNLEALSQAIFKSWFVDFDPVHAKARGEKPFGMDEETAALFPNSFEESENGLIPASWTWIEIQKLYDVAIGRTPPRKEREWFVPGGTSVSWVSIRDMGNFGLFTEKTSEDLTAEAVQKFRIPIVPRNSVLMSFKLTVGKLCIASEDLVTNEAIAHFKPSSKGIETPFCYFALKSMNMKNLESTSSIGVATNSQYVKKIPILYSSIEIINKFHHHIGPIMERIFVTSKNTKSMMNLREALLSDLISGKADLLEGIHHDAE
jgi:type I restriction enzyme S subunit